MQIEDVDEWLLVIKNIQETDSGGYTCQVILFQKFLPLIDV
jgi:hypothetical protein